MNEIAPSIVFNCHRRFPVGNSAAIRYRNVDEMKMQLPIIPTITSFNGVESRFLLDKTSRYLQSVIVDLNGIMSNYCLFMRR